MKEIVDSWLGTNPMFNKNCKIHYIAYKENDNNYLISCCTRPNNVKSYCLTKELKTDKTLSEMLPYEQSILKDIYKELNRQCQVKN